MESTQKATGFAPYHELLSRAREVALLNGTCAVLGWDQDTYMPEAAEAFRADQVARLRGMAHGLATAPEVNDLLKACEDHGFTPLSIEGINVREWRRDYDRHVKVPPALVEDFERTTSRARVAWATARSKNDFSLFRDHLARILELCREKAEHLGYEDCIYDALLEEFEPGMRTDEVVRLFAELRQALAGVYDHAIAHNSHFKRESLKGRYPTEGQAAFNRKVAEAVGFDFRAGRLDISAHPFSSRLGPRDNRLTTRYDETDFTSSLYGVLHEAGHGLYEQGLPPEYYGTPAGEPVSLGIHESQSRLWENQVGRTIEFWETWFPVLVECLPQAAHLSPEMIAAAVNHISPSFIRIEADELTYPLHIILRFELELRLLKGELAVDDLPAAWNAEFEKLFGLKVPDDARGCLQDIHWSLGSFGYFPTYTLGSLNAAQLYAKAGEQLGRGISGADYSGLLGWLRAKVHSQARRYSPQDLMRAATGEPTRIGYHMGYIQRKIAAFA